MWNLTKIAITAIALVTATPAIAQNKVVQLTSLDWQPYTSEAAPHGASEEVARQAFKAMGYDLVVKYMPWKRAVNTAKTDAAFSGYFPEYFSKDVEKEFIFSSPMGNGPLGLAESKTNPVKWTTPADLSGLTLGNVTGYVNPPSLQDLITAGKITIDEVQDDTLNLKKLMAGRIRAAIIDRNVMTYLLKTDAGLTSNAASIQFNSKVIDDMPLYICFRKDAHGQEMANIFNEGLKKIDVNAIMTKYFNEHLK